MTPKQKAAIKHVIKVKYTNGQITASEYANLVNQLDNLAAAGTTYHDANIALGLTKGSKKTAAPTAAPAPTAAAADPELEKRLQKVYKQAQKELQEKLKEFTEKFKAKDAAMFAKVVSGEITMAEYGDWKAGYVFRSDLWKKKIDQVTGTLLDANQQAMQIINKEKMGVFADNANFTAYQITQDAAANLSFAIYDMDTVARLVRDRPELLPRKEVNGKKDKAWNQRKIANAVSQSIIQGESIPQLAQRIATDTASENGDAMIRYARTAMTSAQNAGRLETMERAKGMGIKVKKKWLATLDSRTRDAHADLDGQVVDIDKPFKSAFGDIMFPGDPTAHPGNVYNCRCTLIYDYEEYPNDPEFDERIQYDDFFTTYKDKEGKEHKVYHRTGSSKVTDMSYAEWKAAKQGNALNDLNLAKVELAQAQKEFVKHKVDENKVYEDLWKDPVTLADYAAKKAGIAAKRDYYTAEIDKLNAAIENGEHWAKPEKVKELEKKRKLLNEFERNGEILEKRNSALKKVQGIYDQVGLQQQAATPAVMQDVKAKKKAQSAAQTTGGVNGQSATQSGAGVAKKGQFNADAWDAKTKKAAKQYSKRDVADKDLRAELDAEWDSLQNSEKYALWEYTHNSNPMNKSLSGYHDSWDRSSFVGYENADWGHEDSWRSVPSLFKQFGKNGHADFHRAITNLTLAIEKTTFKEDRWLVRGSDSSGFAGMLEGGGMDFNQAKALFSGRYNLTQIKSALVGKKAKNHAFTSTGIANDAGFGGEIKYKIYAPKGTRAVYAEPQSYYGQTIDNAEYYKKGMYYSGVGHEAEVLIQRGTTYVIRNIERSGQTYVVEMDVVEQPDYFVYGDEDTFNDGKTRHKK